MSDLLLDIKNKRLFLLHPRGRGEGMNNMFLSMKQGEVLGIVGDQYR